MLRFLSSLIGLFLAMAVLGCHSSLHAEVSIPAPRAKVWQVLTDFEHYDEWNPFFIRAEGKAEVDTKLSLTMQPVGKKQTRFSPKILVVRKEHELVWRGRLGIPGLFDGRHSFLLEDEGERSVRLIQHEDFSGMLVSFVEYEPYRLGFERMNTALRRRALEGLPMGASQSPFNARESRFDRPEAFDRIASSPPASEAHGRFSAPSPEFLALLRPDCGPN